MCEIDLVLQCWYWLHRSAQLLAHASSSSSIHKCIPEPAKASAAEQRSLLAIETGCQLQSSYMPVGYLYAPFVLLFCCTCDYKCVLSFAQGIPGTIHHLTHHLCPLLCWVFQPTHVLSLFRFSVVLQASYLGAETEVRTMPQLRGCVVYAVQLSDQTSMTAKALCVVCRSRTWVLCTVRSPLGCTSETGLSCKVRH